jgi:proline dehydrogenase
VSANLGLARSQLTLVQSAHSSGYILGVKLVRGAYVTSENARAKRTGTLSKVWSTKAESDSCFDACASLLLDEIIESVEQDRPGPSAIFATHNAKSVQKNIQQLNRAGLIEEKHLAYSVDDRLRGRVVFAQLMGEARPLLS